MRLPVVAVLCHHTRAQYAVVYSCWSIQSGQSPTCRWYEYIEVVHSYTTAVQTQPQSSPSPAASLSGYTTTVLGCKSNCRFYDMPHFDLDSYEVKVIPRLPQLQASLKSDHKRLVDKDSIDDVTGHLMTDMTLFSGQRFVVLTTRHVITIVPLTGVYICACRMVVNRILVRRWILVRRGVLVRCRCRVRLVNMTSIDLFIAACSCECSVILTNTSDVPVEHIDVTSSSKTTHDQHLVSEVINWNVANLKAQLPIRPKSQAVLTVYFNGALPLADDTAKVRTCIQLATNTGQNWWSCHFRVVESFIIVWSLSV